MGCDIHPYAEVLTDSGWRKADVEVPHDRNYWAFGILANVRNGHGFAGCDLGVPVKPISEPRGLPPDTSIHETEPDEDFDRDVWLGDHSYSWVTLAELQAVDQSAVIENHGMADKAEVKKFHETGELPKNICGWTNREGAVNFTYHKTVAQCAPLIQKMIDALSHLGDPTKVRIVFGFDS